MSNELTSIDSEIDSFDPTFVIPNGKIKNGNTMPNYPLARRTRKTAFANELEKTLDTRSRQLRHRQRQVKWFRKTYGISSPDEYVEQDILAWALGADIPNGNSDWLEYRLQRERTRGVLASREAQDRAYNYLRHHSGAIKEGVTKRIKKLRSRDLLDERWDAACVENTPKLTANYRIMLNTSTAKVMERLPQGVEVIQRDGQSILDATVLPGLCFNPELIIEIMKLFGNVEGEYRIFLSGHFNQKDPYSLPQIEFPSRVEYVDKIMTYRDANAYIAAWRRYVENQCGSRDYDHDRWQGKIDSHLLTDTYAQSITIPMVSIYDSEGLYMCISYKPRYLKNELFGNAGDKEENFSRISDTSVAGNSKSRPELTVWVRGHGDGRDVDQRNILFNSLVTGFSKS